MPDGVTTWPHSVYDASACCSIHYATLPDGLVYGGLDPEHVRELVERQRVWYDCAGLRHVLTDTQLTLAAHSPTRSRALTQGAERAEALQSSRLGRGQPDVLG